MASCMEVPTLAAGDSYSGGNACDMLARVRMKHKALLICAILTTPLLAQAPPATTTTEPPRQRPAMAETPNTDLYYKLAADAYPQEGVPKGDIKGPFTLPSQAYPGTQHTYWVYVPAQYDSAVPASLMIYNDGQAFMAPDGDIRAQVVMDN